MPGISFADLQSDWQNVLDKVGAHHPELDRGRPDKPPDPPEPPPTLSPWKRAAKLKDWQHLLTALQENRRELPHLEAHRTQLETLLRQMQELIEVQTVLASLKQGATKRLSDLLSDCGRLATVLRYSVKHHYGPAADKLEDFGIGRKDRPSKDA